MDSDNQKTFYSEAVFCDICDKLFEINSKCIHLKALSFEESDRFKHKKLTNKNPDINKISNVIDTFIIEYDKKYDFPLIKYNFKFVFNSPEYVVNIETSPHYSRITMSSGYLPNETINDINIQGYCFDRIDEFNIIAIADNMELTYDFYIKHNMCSFKLKMNLILAKNPHLINSLNRSYNHPLTRKYSHIAKENQGFI